MTRELLELFTRRYIEASQGPDVYFTWHGGEPTLTGVEFYTAAIELQQKYLPAGWKCVNNLQTNGILLDDAWCAFLSEAGFIVGLSIDGVRHIHDTNRTGRDGSGTYAAAAGAVRRLQSYGIQPDLLCTVAAQAASEPLAVYRALRGFGTGWIQFIPIVRRGSGCSTTPDSVSTEGYGDFLCKIFDEWLCHDLGKLDVQLFAEAGNIYSGAEAGLCWMAPVCGRALIVERDGGVYSCDHFATKEYRLGDIGSASLRELADSPRQTAFGDGKRGTPGTARAA